MREVKEIALAFPRGAHQVVFIEGVLQYAAENDLNWSYITAPESLSLSVLDLIGWPGDGILAALNTTEEATCATQLGLPVINISSALTHSPTPRSVVDNRAIGALAAEHLISKGFQNFAYYGLSDVEYSNSRHVGYEARLGAAGYTSVELMSAPTFGLRESSWLHQHRAVASWLTSLPTPCGLLAVSDYRARQALDACRREGINVPEEIAVIGVDNEQVICEHAYPTLSSVARNDRLEGFRAAALLDRMINGADIADRVEPIPPLQVIERESTATFAVSDSRLRAALTYLHDRIEEPISIDDVTRHCDVSRRWLEYAFRDTLGDTPYQYLRRQRLLYAKRLLADEPRTRIYSIAQRTGFSSAKQLTIAFHQMFGVSPREFRLSTQT